jgi:N-acetylneuraminate synthase
VDRIKVHGNPLTVFQCTSAYPCPPEKVGLNVVRELRERYGCRVGLSDHSGTVFAGLAAVTLGVDALEVHVTLSREMFGPDVPASLTTYELRELVHGVRFIERMNASFVNKDAVAAEMTQMRRVFSKSIVAARNLVAGKILSADDLCLRKPGSGIPPNRLPEIIGQRLSKTVAAGELLSEEHLSRLPETARAAR